MNPDIIVKIKALASEIAQRAVEHRRHLHMYPELSYQEYKSMEYVSEVLTKLGINHATHFGDTGVVAIIKGSSHTLDMECIGLRADLDALPIHEQNECEYKSTIDGVMHACGHDVHTAVLLGAAEVIHQLREELPQPVKLVFQPGEEKNPGGATLMIRDGVLENPKVKEMYALHVFPDLECGHIGFKSGIYMASCDEIHLTIHGKGGHGATPHNCIDPIIIGSKIVLSLQEIVTRNCDPKIPCVLSIGHFEALGATNVIPETAHLKGTFRTMNEEWRAKALELIEKNIKGIAESSGATVELEISKGYPYLENNPETTSKQRLKAVQILGQDRVHELPIRLASEDFSYYSQEIPTCFFRLGVRNEEKGIIHSVHHPKFDIDENSIETGILLMSAAAF